MLPGVVMAMGGQVFELLYQISELEDPRLELRFVFDNLIGTRFL